MTTSLAMGICGSSAERHAAMFPLSGRLNNGQSQIKQSLINRSDPPPPPKTRIFEDSVGGGSRLAVSTNDIAAATARKWMANPAMKMMLPQVHAAADADGDGTIDRAEFNTLLSMAGAGGADASRLFAQADADGDGELTFAEMQALSGPSTKAKCSNL